MCVNDSEMSLTVVVPIRWTGDRRDALERLEFLTQDSEVPGGVEVLVVDDGSPVQSSEEIRAACSRLGFRFHRIESEFETFSIGRARNVGAQLANSRFVMFQDADLLPYPGFYRDVLIEAEVQGVATFAERFLMFGVIYLTPLGTKEYFQTPDTHRKSKFIQYLLDDDREKIEKFSTGTSVTLWSRDYYLSAGGNDPDFAGWGYEDLEFACRSIRRAKRFQLPSEFSLDYRNFQSVLDYRGWKAVYRLFGDITFKKGMVLFHAWHPIEEKSAYVKAKDRNRKLFDKKLNAFKVSGEEPDPLPRPERGRSVIFRTNPWVYSRWVAPMLGETVLVDEDMFSAQSFLSFCAARKIDRVVFHNPYANERMIDIYFAVRTAGLAFVVCERGALPGSMFFDPNGFNGESSSYKPERWDRALTAEEQQRVCDYVQAFKAGGISLEEQSESIGVNALRRRLGVPTGAKILFVPLQRPSDTVIEHLAGPIGSYEQFLILVRRVAFALPPDWVVVAKRHPLEAVSPSLPSVVFADCFNINDLVEASSALLLINSGVGLTGIVYEKPVLYAGQAFYGWEGLAKQVSCHEDVLKAIEEFEPDRLKVLRFLYYLVFEFYSFGQFKTRRVAWTDGAFMTATTGIDFHVIRFPECREVRMEWRDAPLVPMRSILFDRYRNSDGSLRFGPSSAKASPMGASAGGRILSPGRALANVGGGAGRTAMDQGGASGRRGLGSVFRKFRKLRGNPVMFLRDSRFRPLRWIGWSIRKG